MTTEQSKLADELDTALTKYLNAPKGLVDGMNMRVFAGAQLTDLLWDNKAGIIAALRAPTPDTRVREALDSIDSQLDEMRSLKGWRLNLIRENMAKLRAALTARVDAPAAPPADAVRALRKARDAIASLPEYALGGASVEHTDGSGELYQYPLRDELLAEIDATLPPDAGSRK